MGYLHIVLYLFYFSLMFALSLCQGEVGGIHPPFLQAPNHRGEFWPWGTGPADWGSQSFLQRCPWRSQKSYRQKGSLDWCVLAARRPSWTEIIVDYWMMVNEFPELRILFSWLWVCHVRPGFVMFLEVACFLIGQNSASSRLLHARGFDPALRLSFNFNKFRAILLAQVRHVHRGVNVKVLDCFI